MMVWGWNEFIYGVSTILYILMVFISIREYANSPEHHAIMSA